MKFNLTFLVAFDVLISITALFSAAVARFGYTETWEKLGTYVNIHKSLIFVFVVLFASYLMESYDHRKNTKRREIAINILFGSATSFSILSVIYYINPDFILGRGVLALSLCLSALLQFCWHSLFLLGKNYPRFSQRFLVLGTGTLAVQIGKIISTSTQNFALVGYASCCLEPQANFSESDLTTVPQGRILGNSDDLLNIAQKARIDVIVVALSERRGVFPLKDVLKCKLDGIQIMEAPSLYELIEGKLMLESITPSSFIFSGVFLRATIFRVFKRAIDIVISCTGLLLTIPFFPLIALAIKFDSCGPVFFTQQRVGYKEKLFVLYKFRTMGLDAEKERGAVWAEKNDPRITRLGRLLRRSRIDEIPQLINVLKGEMSFVGPRPERPEFVDNLKRLIPFYSERHFIKPGVTGWAQVRYPYGSSVEDAYEKLRYDLYYIKSSGPFLDTLIFFETIKVVLFGFGGR